MIYDLQIMQYAWSCSPQFSASLPVRQGYCIESCEAKYRLGKYFKKNSMWCCKVSQEMSRTSIHLALKHSYEENDAAALFYRWANWGLEGRLPAGAIQLRGSGTSIEARSFSGLILSSQCTGCLEHLVNDWALASGIFILLSQTCVVSPWGFHTKSAGHLFFPLQAIAKCFSTLQLIYSEGLSRLSF